MTTRLARLAFIPAALLAAAIVWRFDATSDPVAAVPAPAGTDSEMHFTLGERALLDCLKAALPQTVNVGSGLFATELTFLDPSDLVLKQDGTASCRVRVKGRTLPVDQVIKPVLRVERDAKTGGWYGVVQSLPLQLPGMGSLDLKDTLPRVEIPQVIDNLRPFGDKPSALKLSIRSIAILEHRVEIAADLDLSSGVTPRGRPSS
ncbi:MAG TPA: hypothetical protein VFC25_04970 [Verrucomicrobiae bacterium]|nr:hypothetical protein [Verrucomicrobiae bacterium]